MQDLLRASAGLNLGVDFLPGALDYDPVAFPVDPLTAGRVLWFDAVVGNMDRSYRNPNLLEWRGMWLIDHGATLSFHHRWATAEGYDARPYEATDHVLIGSGGDVASADAELGPLLTDDALAAAVAEVPDAWLDDEPGIGGPDCDPRRLRRAAGGPARRPRVVASRPDRRSRTRGGPMSTERHLYEYAVLRVVPRVERGELINAGVIVYCRPLEYLGSRVLLDRARLAALDPELDPEPVARALAAAADCALRGDDDLGRRFRWLTAPRSTVVQPGPVHTGLTHRSGRGDAAAVRRAGASGVTWVTHVASRSTFVTSGRGRVYSSRARARPSRISSSP